jgi:hypothetical protein
VWKNIVEPEMAQKKIWRMCIACWIPKAVETHSKYVILSAFPLQLCLRVEQHCRAGDGTEENMARVHCVLDT